MPTTHNDSNLLTPTQQPLQNEKNGNSTRL
jgi:hypothetical protein